MTIALQAPQAAPGHGVTRTRRTPLHGARSLVDDLEAAGNQAQRPCLGLDHPRQRPLEDLLVATADAIEEPIGPDVHLPPQATHGAVLDLQGCIAPHDPIVHAQGRVQPAQARLAPELAVPVVREDLRLHREADGDRRRRRVGRADRDAALVVPRYGLLGDLQPQPERLDLPRRHRHRLPERLAVPVDPAGVEAAQRRSRQDRSLGRGAQLAELDRDGIQRLSHRVDAELEGEELLTLRLAVEGHRGPRLDPAQGQVYGHANGVAAILRKHQVRLRVALEELPGLGRGRDDLHGVEAVERRAGFEAHRLCLREPLPGRCRQLVRGQRTAFPPGGVGAVFRRVVVPRVVVTRPLRRGCGEVVDLVVARRGLRLEGQDAGLTLDADPHDVRQPLVRRGIDDHDVLRVGVVIAPPPGNGDLYGGGFLLHPDPGTVVPQAFFPGRFGNSVGNFAEL